MMKLVKLLLLLVILVVGAGAAIGFTQDPKMSARTTVVIDAEPEDVWDVVGDPRRTGEWLPADLMKIEKVEVLGKGILEKAAGAALDKLLGTDTKSGEMTPTHKYLGPDGKFLAMQVVAVEKEKRYVERVVGGNLGVERFFDSMAWGFELEPTDGGKKTKLTVVQEGLSKKPVGTLLKTVMQWLGKPKSNAERMAKNIEAVAKKS